MAGLSPGLRKAFKAGVAIGSRKIVKFGADDATVVLGAASTDLLIGVSGELDAELGENVDISLDGVVEVTFGGTVVRGDGLTSDATGRAIAAAPAAGVNARIIGIAMCSAVVGDIGPAFLSPGRIQG